MWNVSTSMLEGLYSKLVKTFGSTSLQNLKFNATLCGWVAQVHIGAQLHPPPPPYLLCPVCIVCIFLRSMFHLGGSMCVFKKTFPLSIHLSQPFLQTHIQPSIYLGKM